MVSVVIEAFKKLFGIQRLGFFITLHSPPARLTGLKQIQLIGTRNSRDHRGVRNKEDKFI